MQLRAEVGRAINVAAMRKKARLCVNFDVGPRKYVVLPMPWLPASSPDILQAALTLYRLLSSGMGLDAAKAQVVGSRHKAISKPASSSSLDLMGIWEKFGDYKVRGTGQIKPSTWQKDYRITGERLLEVQSSDFQSAKDLLRAISERWKPGTRRREIALQQVTAMLRWGIEEELLPAERWTPPQQIRAIVGPKAHKDPSFPLKDDQILRLLDALPRDDAGKRWRFALQLVATYGLRPIELLHLQIRPDGKLWCNYQKTSSRGRTKARELRPLLSEWAEDWRLIPRLLDGEPLPPLDSKGGAADCMRKYLLRQRAWKELTAADPITTYSFRHGYALRAHQTYGLSPRVTSELMGHSLDTHNSHYGQWTDSATIDLAIQNGERYRQQVAKGMV
jgi:integrase